MKNSRKIIIAVLSIFFALIVINKVNAQTNMGPPDCNYTIHSSFNCSGLTNVKVEFYDITNTICSSQVVVLNTGPNPITCNCSPGTLNNVVITFLTLDGNPITSGAVVDNGTLYQPNWQSTTSISNCAPTFQMHWNNDSTHLTH